MQEYERKTVSRAGILRHSKKLLKLLIPGFTGTANGPWMEKPELYCKEMQYSKDRK